MQFILLQSEKKILYQGLPQAKIILRSFLRDILIEATSSQKVSATSVCTDDQGGVPIFGQ